MKEKHLTYFKILDALSAKECPICFLINENVKKYFDGLLYENINDVGFRDKFRKNYGFCNRHSYQFLNYNDGLAIALTHRDLLIDVIGELKRRKAKYPAENSKCIVCELMKETEKRYVSVTIESLLEEEFKSKFLLSEGLCVPHLKKILKNVVSPHRWLIDFHLKKYNEYLSMLDKYIDSCNYSLPEKPLLINDDERLIWKKVVKMLFGSNHVELWNIS